MKLELPSEIFIATAPIDLRLSFDRLAGVSSLIPTPLMSHFFA